MNTLVVAAQALALICGCVVLMCRFAHMDANTPADVRYQHGWLFASLAMAAAMRAEYGADASTLCVTLGVLLYLFYGSRRWLSKVGNDGASPSGFSDSRTASMCRFTGGSRK